MCENINSPKNTFIGIDEVCQLTSLSKHTIYRKVKRKELPAYRFALRLNFKEDEVMAWMHSNSTIAKKEAV